MRANLKEKTNYQGSGKLAQSDKEAGGGRHWLPARQLTAKAAVTMAGLRTHRPRGGNNNHKQHTHVNAVKTEPSMAGSTPVQDKWIISIDKTQLKS